MRIYSAELGLTTTHDGIPYQVRVSARTRRVKLAFNPYRGLEIVIPRRFPRREIARILQQHASWISEQYHRHADKLCAIELPATVAFALSAETYGVTYRQTATGHSRETDSGVVIDAADDEQAIRLLRRWLRRQAERRLKPMLSDVSKELQLGYSRCTVRGQKSRWGSCSSRSSISLNEQLLFMPPATVRYLMIHELCHTRHLNHSADFWRLVASFEPDYRRHEQALDQGRRQVPDWYLQSLYRSS